MAAPAFAVGDQVTNQKDRVVHWPGGQFTAAVGFPWLVKDIKEDPAGRVHRYDLAAVGMPAIKINLPESVLTLVEKATTPAKKTKARK